MKVFELLTNKEIEEILEKEPLGSEIIGELFKILIERGEENDTTKDIEELNEIISLNNEKIKDDIKILEKQINILSIKSEENRKLIAGNINQIKMLVKIIKDKL